MSHMLHLFASRFPSSDVLTVFLLGECNIGSPLDGMFVF
jgi:hypothetical protein